MWASVSRIARPARSNNRSPLGSTNPDRVRLALTGDMAQRDFTALPDTRSPQRRKPALDDTQVMPIVEQTIVLSRIRPDTPPPSTRPELPNVDPTEIVSRGSRAARVFRVLLPPRVRTYIGGISGAPASSWSPGAAVSEDPTPYSLPAAQQRVLTALRGHAGGDPSAGPRWFEEWQRGFDARKAELNARWDNPSAVLAPATVDMTAAVQAAARLASALADDGTSAALYTADELAHEIARRALAASAVSA